MGGRHRAVYRRRSQPCDPKSAANYADDSTEHEILSIQGDAIFSIGGLIFSTGVCRVEMVQLH
jgi:hypothetical protein